MIISAIHANSGSLIRGSSMLASLRCISPARRASSTNLCSILLVVGELFFAPIVLLIVTWSFLIDLLVGHGGAIFAEGLRYFCD